MTSVFRDVATSKEWGMSPSKFWSLSKDDQALMMAFIEASSEMNEYDSIVRQRAMESKSRHTR